MRSPHEPQDDSFDAITLRHGRARIQAEAERRLRLAFPEVWARYEQLAAERGIRSARPRAAARPR
jgi:hypothetical protein